jgi:hypothetical protein
MLKLGGTGDCLFSLKGHLVHRCKCVRKGNVYVSGHLQDEALGRISLFCVLSFQNFDIASCTANFVFVFENKRKK